MENINVKIEILSCVYDELNEQDKALVDLAKQATANSYSPYSHFRVGAAIRLSDDSTIIGANQENAAFGVTLCAERSDRFYRFPSDFPGIGNYNRAHHPPG